MELARRADLTMRTVILNHGLEKYEKVSHSKLANQQFEIKLSDYIKMEKALILDKCR